MGSALRLSAGATSSAAGAATFNFPAPTLGEVWTGSVFVSSAPSGASSSVTIGSTSGGVPWGTMVGGQALQVQALPGEVIQVLSTNLLVSTAYQAVLAGSVDSAQDATFVGPFPVTPSNEGGAVYQTTPPTNGGVVWPTLGPVTLTAGTPAYWWGAWAAAGTVTVGTPLMISQLAVLNGGATAYWAAIEFQIAGNGPAGEATFYLPASGSVNLSVYPAIKLIGVGVNTNIQAQLAASVAGVTCSFVPNLLTAV